MKSIIGKTYIPNDNSYAVNLTKASKGYGEVCNNLLAGTQLTNNIGKECIIVSEPFISINYHGYKIPMIIVMYNNETHCVMYNEYCIK